MEKSYVYILIHTDRKKIKIGKANNINKRCGHLNKVWNGFILEESYIIETSLSYVNKLEKLLHYYFDDFLLSLDSKNDGYTEFFDIKCLPDVLSFIKTIHNKGVKVNRGIKLIKKNTNICNKKETKEYFNINKSILENDNNLSKITGFLDKNIYQINKSENGKYDILTIKGLKIKKDYIREYLSKILLCNIWGSNEYCFSSYIGEIIPIISKGDIVNELKCDLIKTYLDDEIIIKYHTKFNNYLNGV